MGNESSEKSWWPIYLAVIVLIVGVIIFLKDWSRYPTVKELENFLELSDPRQSTVEVIEMKEISNEYDSAMSYKILYHFEQGSSSEEVYMIKKKDRKSVYPWHDYYATQNKLNLEQR